MRNLLSCFCLLGLLVGGAAAPSFATDQGDKPGGRRATTEAPVKAVPHAQRKNKPQRVDDEAGPDRSEDRSARGSRPERTARSARGSHGAEAGGRGARGSAGGGRAGGAGRGHGRGH